MEVVPLRRTISVDERGVITIKFSKEMNFPSNLVELIESGKKDPKRRSLSSEILAVNIMGASEQSSENLELEWDIICVEKVIKTNSEGEPEITTCEFPSKNEI
jgi:hypothetical protein